MSEDAEDGAPVNCAPGPDVTRKLFRRWQKARRGTEQAQELTNPVWEWLFQGRIDPYHAHVRFKSPLARIFRRIDFPSEPRWAGCRMGQSCTRLSDGREFWIAGEHEDYYDPDFYIYNDVIVRHPDQRLQIFGYSTSDFRPTDFHSATAFDNDCSILIMGSIGYPDDRREGVTQLYRLNTGTLHVSELQTTGDAPGWIHKHQAALSADGRSVVVQRGQVWSGAEFLENIDEWSLDLTELRWTRLTRRQWPRFRVSREDGESLHLWQYDMLELDLHHPRLNGNRSEQLSTELGIQPNVDAFHRLYRPSIAHEVIANEPEDAAEDEEDWCTTRILIDSVCVRFVHDLDHVTVTVEGDLPSSQCEQVARELQENLSLVENAACTITKLG